MVIQLYISSSPVDSYFSYHIIFTSLHLHLASLLSILMVYQPPKVLATCAEVSISESALFEKPGNADAGSEAWDGRQGGELPISFHPKFVAEDICFRSASCSSFFAYCHCANGTSSCGIPRCKHEISKWDSHGIGVSFDGQWISSWLTTERLKMAPASSAAA